MRAVPRSRGDCHALRGPLLLCCVLTWMAVTSLPQAAGQFQRIAVVGDYGECVVGVLCLCCACAYV